MSASPEPAAPPATARPKWKGPWGWVSTTYFAEGYPYTIVNSAADALFTMVGVTLSSLGLTSLLHLPWNLKFLWGPFVDQYETKRRWLLGTEVLLCIILLAMTLFGGTDAPLWLLALLFVLLAMLSATHDIAVDGFYLEGLDTQQQARYVGYRAGAYRLAMLAVGGPLLVLAGVTGWRTAWGLSFVVMAALTAYHAIALPRPEARQRPIHGLLRRIASPKIVVPVALLAGSVWFAHGRDYWGIPARIRASTESIPVLGTMALSGWISLALFLTLLLMLTQLSRIRGWLDRHDSAYARSFVVFLDQPRVGPLLAFVVLFRTGESFLQKARFPFLNVELELSLSTIGIANGTVGVVASLVATMLGGYLIAKHGLRRWIWPFLIAQNVLNLLYAGLALWPDPSQIGIEVIAAVVTIEHFGAGLGTAVFMIYLMRCCDPAHKAAHMALVTALMSVGFTLAGIAGGALAEVLGYGTYFVFTFVATLPMMALVFVVPHLSPEKTAQ